MKKLLSLIIPAIILVGCNSGGSSSSNNLSSNNSSVSANNNTQAINNQWQRIGKGESDFSLTSSSNFDPYSHAIYSLNIDSNDIYLCKLDFSATSQAVPSCKVSSILNDYVTNSTFVSDSNGHIYLIAQSIVDGNFYLLSYNVTTQNWLEPLPLSGLSIKDMKTLIYNNNYFYSNGLIYISRTGMPGSEISNNQDLITINPVNAIVTDYDNFFMGGIPSYYFNVNNQKIYYFSQANYALNIQNLDESKSQIIDTPNIDPVMGIAIDESQNIYICNNEQGKIYTKNLLDTDNNWHEFIPTSITKLGQSTACQSIASAKIDGHNYLITYGYYYKTQYALNPVYGWSKFLLN
ncbi:MAG: hypothetical protein RLZZ293_142 [Pseudomonadota bacterium]|jgi:hypothetical protein